jgi:uncharacterized repeat protein (TIGR04138 family)
MNDGWTSAYAAMHRNGAAEFPPAALRYVLELTRNESRRMEAPLAPVDIVTTFRKSARADFGPLLPDVLEHWELRTPEALGRAVDALGRYGCLTLDAGDGADAFAADALPLAEAEA